MLYIKNHGPLIEDSNFWDSEQAAAGYLYLSTNAGALRLLVPGPQREIISDMRPGSKHIQVSFLPTDQCAPGKPCAEWLVEDGSDNPWSCLLSPGQLDRSASPDDVGREWIATVWDWKNRRPHKCLERPAFVQIVPTLPWLRRIGT